MQKKILFTLITTILFFGFLEIVLQFAGVILMKPQIHANKIKPADKKSFRILTLGESTTADYFAKDGENISWPRGLEKKLNDSGYNVRVYNEGISGVTSIHLLRELNKNLELYKPHLVIAMMGINDSKHLYFEHSSGLIEGFMNLKTFKVIRWIKSVVFPKKRNRANELMTKEDSIVLNNLIDKIKTNNKIEKDLLEAGLLQATGESQFIDTLYWATLPATPHLASKEELSLSDEIADMAYSMFPNNRGAVGVKLQSFLYNKDRESCFKLGIDAVKKGIELTQDTIARTGYCLNLQNPKQVALFEKYFSGVKVAQKYNPDHHYKILFDKIKKSSANLILMQYPTLSVDVLKNYFKKEKYSFPKLSFVGNEKNFTQALEKYSYDEIFLDRFAVDWGHATKLGNQLIINNLGQYILNKKYLDGFEKNELTKQK